MIGRIRSVDNYIRLPEPIFNQFKTFLQTNYPDLPGVNGTLFIGGAINDITKFPTFDIRVSGILFHLPPYQYFINYDGSVNEFYLGIQSTPKVYFKYSFPLTTRTKSNWVWSSCVDTALSLIKRKRDSQRQIKTIAMLQMIRMVLVRWNGLLSL